MFGKCYLSKREIDKMPTIYFRLKFFFQFFIKLCMGHVWNNTPLFLYLPISVKFLHLLNAHKLYITYIFRIQSYGWFWVCCKDSTETEKMSRFAFFTSMTSRRLPTQSSYRLFMVLILIEPDRIFGINLLREARRTFP